MTRPGPLCTVSWPCLLSLPLKHIDHLQRCHCQRKRRGKKPYNSCVSREHSFMALSRAAVTARCCTRVTFQPLPPRAGGGGGGCNSSWRTEGEAPLVPHCNILMEKEVAGSERKVQMMMMMIRMMMKMMTTLSFRPQSQQWTPLSHLLRASIMKHTSCTIFTQKENSKQKHKHCYPKQRTCWTQIQL